MHQSVRNFIREIRKERPSKFRLKYVLDVGAANINGSARDYFWFCRYVGIDISKGKGVDIVANFNDYKFVNLFDCVVSCEMLEHDNQWQMSLIKMYDLLEPNGMLLITCANLERQEHGTRRTTPEDSPDTTDYYRNISKEDFKSILPESLFKTYVLMNARDLQDLYFFGIKKERRTLAFGTSYDPK